VLGVIVGGLIAPDVRLTVNRERVFDALTRVDPHVEGLQRLLVEVDLPRAGSEIAVAGAVADRDHHLVAARRDAGAGGERVVGTTHELGVVVPVAHARRGGRRREQDECRRHRMPDSHREFPRVEVHS
jgi:hypothetical protein